MPAPWYRPCDSSCPCRSVAESAFVYGIGPKVGSVINGRPERSDDERMANAEQSAREEISEQIAAFRKPRKPRRNKEQMAEARAQRKIEDRGRQHAATSGTYLEGATEEDAKWLQSIREGTE